MIRSSLFIGAAALVLAACDFPPVPRGADSGGIREGQWMSPVPGPRTPPAYGVGGEVETAGEERFGEPREVRGRLVGNAVSSFVIEAEDGGWVTVQMTPQTRLRIGDEQAGLREIQPGSEVRASFVPAGEGRKDLALEVVAEPRTDRWNEPRFERGATPAE